MAVTIREPIYQRILIIIEYHCIFMSFDFNGETKTNKQQNL